MMEQPQGHTTPVSGPDPGLTLTISQPARQVVTAALFLLIMLLLVYFPGFSGQWCYDDYPNIVDNANVHPTALTISSVKQAFYQPTENPLPPHRIQRPLAFLSFAVNWYLGQDRVFGYHGVNFAIHLITAVVLYLLIRKTLTLPVLECRYHAVSHGMACLAAVIWAMHPIQVTAVTYIVQRMTAMAGMFYLMALYFYLKARCAGSRKGAGCFFICSGLCAALAWATKENTVILPVTILVYEIILIRGVDTVDRKTVLRWSMPALVLVILITLIYVNPLKLLAGYHNRPFTPFERVLTEARVVWYYARLLFYPLLSEFTLVHDVNVSVSPWSPWTTAASILAIAGTILWSVLRLSRKQPLVAFAILFFFINQAIEASFIPLELIYEHRNYIPSMFIFLLPAMLLIQTLRYFAYNRKFQFFIVFSGAVVLASIGHTTYAYNRLFQNSLRLWADNARKSPRLSVVLNNYGVQLMQSGLTDQAFYAFQRAIQLDRYFNQAQQGLGDYNLGVYYETVAHDHQKALSFYRKAIGRALHSKMMWYSMSISLLYNGKTEQAEKAIRQALVQRPDDPDFLLAQAGIRIMGKAWDQALEIIRRVRRRYPQAVEPLALLGEIYRQTGDVERAIFFWNAYREKSDRPWIADLALTDLYAKTKRADLRQQTLCRLRAAMPGQRDLTVHADRDLVTEMLAPE